MKAEKSSEMLKERDLSPTPRCARIMETIST
jgi:hypothetical protein